MFKIMPESEGTTLGIKIEGKVKDADYKELMPKLDKIIEEKGTVNILFDLQDWGGYTLEAMVDDTKCCIKNHDKMGKVAIVGDKEWEKVGTKMSKPFMAAEMKYFDVSELEDAWKWVKA